MIFNKILTKKTFSIAEVIIIIGLAFFPLFFNFPYRINIFLSWEGAYRLYLGQVPYKDFGLPMGFGYWIIPAFFFKIFGPYMFTLVKAQVLLNIISGLTFRAILKTLSVRPVQRFLSVLLYVISFSFFNFWPWYNHTVVVYEFIGIYFVLLTALASPSKKLYTFLYPFLCALFRFLAFFTKQDAGALGFMICFVLLSYHTYVERSFKEILLFCIFFGIVAAAFILPFARHGFFYWFNYGQPPHNSRITAADFLNEIFNFSNWIKGYLFVIALILLNKIHSLKSFLQQKSYVLFLLMTTGVLVQALLHQVTSYIPPDNNIYFHSFAFAFIISSVSFNVTMEKTYVAIVATFMMLFWWSGMYWKYIQNIIARYTTINVYNLSTHSHKIIKDTTLVDVSEWKLSALKAFENIYLPQPTIDGIKRVMALDVVKDKRPKVLNMTELSPLAYEMGYELEKGLPLWYHQRIAIFDKEVDVFCKRIESGYYDLVLFEDIPYLQDFWPEKVRQTLKNHYHLQDSFLAPRRPTDSTIEVYVKK